MGKPPRGYETMGMDGRKVAALPGKLRIGFANLSMQRKLLIVFLFLISLPIMAVSYFSYQDYSSSIKAGTTEYATEIAAKTLKQLDDYITDLYNMSAMPLYNSDFLEDLAADGSGLEKQNRMDLYIMNLNKIKPDTVSVYVFDRFGRTYFNVKSGGTRIHMDEVSPLWARIAREGDGRPVLVSTQEVPTDKQSYYAFTVIRELKELSLMRPIGYIAFDTNINAIHRSIQDVDRVTKGTTLLVDERNRVVYDSELKMINRDLSEDPLMAQATEARGHFSAVIDGKNYIAAYVRSELTGWRMLVHIPVEEALQRAAKTRNVTLLTTLAIIGFALAASTAIAYALTRPLRNIKLLMREVQHGRLDVSFNARYNDEVGSLGRHFNLMVDRVQSLLAEVNETQARKKEAEINALQNQINPHFIYNTLETIRMTAEFKGDAEIAEMTWTLGKLLRYGIIQGNEIVTVREEMEHLRNYVALQNFRFDDRFILLVDIPESILHYPCLKLMFQPIVENAINHAFKNMEGPGTIRIYPEIDEHALRFIVEDDGAGMDEAALSRLGQRLDGTGAASPRGLGLRNVNERIKLHYGSKYGLSWISLQGTTGIDRPTGTAITLTLPRA